jgi:hypothetical protein
MEKTKIIVLITALTVLAATLIGVTYAQNTNNQSLRTNGYHSPAPQTYNNGYYSCPRNSHAYGTPQNLNPISLEWAQADATDRKAPSRSSFAAFSFFKEQTYSDGAGEYRAR